MTKNKEQLNQERKPELANEEPTKGEKIAYKILKFVAPIYFASAFAFGFLLAEKQQQDENSQNSIVEVVERPLDEEQKKQMINAQVESLFARQFKSPHIEKINLSTHDDVEFFVYSLLGNLLVNEYLSFDAARGWIEELKSTLINMIELRKGSGMVEVYIEDGDVVIILPATTNSDGSSALDDSSASLQIKQEQIGNVEQTVISVDRMNFIINKGLGK